MQMEPFGAIGAGWFNGCRLIQQVPFESTRAVWGRLGHQEPFGAIGVVWQQRLYGRNWFNSEWPNSRLKNAAAGIEPVTSRAQKWHITN